TLGSHVCLRLWLFVGSSTEINPPAMESKKHSSHAEPFFSLACSSWEGILQTNPTRSFQATRPGTEASVVKLPHRVIESPGQRPRSIILGRTQTTRESNTAADP